jgi:hypothetical protein
VDVVVRLILRFLLVPLGAMVATVTSVALVVLAHWQAFASQATFNSELHHDYFIALIVAAPAILLVLSLTGVLVLVPAAIGVLVAEAFAIRSWIYHAANGALSAWIGWSLIADTPDRYFTDAKLIVAAGLAAGLAYWLVAGWTSGFWKPLAQPAPSRAQSPADARSI